MKQTAKFLIPFLLFLILAAPVATLAQENQGLIPCGRTKDEGVDPKTTEKCGFKDFLTLINKVITFILVVMAVPIAAIMFFYAGLLMITAGGEAAGARTKAKGIFMNALIGLLLAAGSWLIVRTLLSILGFDGAWIGF